MSIKEELEEILFNFFTEIQFFNVILIQQLEHNRLKMCTAFATTFCCRLILIFRLFEFAILSYTGGMRVVVYAVCAQLVNVIENVFESRKSVEWGGIGWRIFLLNSTLGVFIVTSHSTAAVAKCKPPIGESWRREKRASQHERCERKSKKRRQKENIDYLTLLVVYWLSNSINLKFDETSKEKFSLYKIFKFLWKNSSEPRNQLSALVILFSRFFYSVSVFTLSNTVILDVAKHSLY